MRSVARRLASAALTPSRDAVRGFLTTGGRMTHPIELPRRSCATLVSIASPGVRDMDAAIYSPEGELLAADSQPDARPTIQLCTGNEQRMLYYAVHVYEGAGSFLMVPFVGPQEMLEQAADVLGVKPVVARLDGADFETKTRVSAFRDGLRRRGFDHVQAPLPVALLEDQRLRVPLGVEPGRCYTAAGFALEGLHDVNLRVLDEEGFEISRDQSPEMDASAQFCADRNAQFAVELHGKKGAGESLFLLLGGDASGIGGISALWLGERPLARASTVPLEQVVADLGARAARAGFRGGKTLRQGRLMPGEAVAEPAVIPAGRCVRVHAAGGEGVRMLALRALDAQGATLQAIEGEATTTYVHLCSTETMPVRLQVHALAGSGRYALTWYEAPLARIEPKGADDPLRAQLQQVEKSAQDAGYRPHTRFETGPLPVSLHRAEPVTIKLEPIAGQCLRAYVVSAERGAFAEFVTGSKRVGQPTQAGEPALFCAGEGSVKLPVELRIASEEADARAWLWVVVK
jgi:hypothetical protein